jgi:uncharacterized caspase-like protein
MMRRILFAIAVVLSSTAWVLSHAQAQNGAQEKRIAFVVGNGAYQKDPLQTTANDAGLIAQTLQAAGFDVIGARDLDGETLRRSFRDFIQKAQSSGPDTVAFVYLAGYGVQLTGENYFVPIDANIARDTDVPVEALRIADYMRQLSALPLKAGVIVLDAARANPFAKEGQPLAGGLALVEPDPKILTAFNAAPGTVAPEGQPPYGAYAQALAEMIRAGGLTLPEVFDRVRLRVNETTQGAQIPWDTQKVDGRFVFFERAPDAPPVADQSAALRSKPIRDFSAQEAFTAAIERDTLQDYENFLVAFPNDPLAKRVRAIVAARREAITWRRTYRTDTPAAYWSYLDRYPRGPHAADARRRLTILAAALEPPPTYERFAYDVPPPPPDEIVYVDRPALYFNDPVFAFAPPPPPPVYYLPPPPPEFVVLPPPPPPVGLFILPTPRFVPIPAYVRAPAYVAPPPNNIIFTNIHNTTVINNVINNPTPPPQPVAPVPGGAPDIVKTDGSRVTPGVAAVAAGAAAAAIAIPAAAAALPPAALQKAGVLRQQQPLVAPGTAPASLQQPAPGVPPVAPQKNAVTPPHPWRSDTESECACTAGRRWPAAAEAEPDLIAGRYAAARCQGSPRQSGTAEAAGAWRPPVLQQRRQYLRARRPQQLLQEPLVLSRHWQQRRQAARSEHRERAARSADPAVGDRADQALAAGHAANRSDASAESTCDASTGTDAEARAASGCARHCDRSGECGATRNGAGHSSVVAYRTAASARTACRDTLAAAVAYRADVSAATDRSTATICTTCCRSVTATAVTCGPTAASTCRCAPAAAADSRAIASTTAHGASAATTASGRTATATARRSTAASAAAADGPAARIEATARCGASQAGLSAERSRGQVQTLIAT